MRRLKSLVVVSFAIGSFALAAPSAIAKDSAKKPAVAAKKPAKKKLAPVSAAKKKVLAELMGGFKFGLSKDEVLAILGKQIDERYEEKIKATTDITAQDRLRRDKKEELARVGATFVSFDGNKTGWDVSIIEGEFAHHTNESMMERWENKDGKNQRRFFFFHEGKLWKMFVQLDLSILPADKQNFDTFQAAMQNKYGPGNVEPSLITWHAGDFDVRAVDKLKTYAMIALVIENNRAKNSVLALRDAKKEKAPETNSVIKAVVDPDQKDQPDVKQNANAVENAIKAQGGATPAPKK